MAAIPIIPTSVNYNYGLFINQNNRLKQQKNLTSMEQESDTTRGQHSLLHWEALFVTSTSDFKNISFKFLQYQNYYSG